MKVLMLGGTGAMGRHLVRMLDAKGNQVFVTSRTRSGDDGNVQYLKGNARDQAFTASLLSQSWDAIVDFMVYGSSEFNQRYKYYLDSTRQYVFLSSARVYAESDEPITESSPRLLDVTTDTDYLKTDEYALAKARQEDLLFKSGKKNWTIIRPYITYDDERLQLGVLEKEEWLYRALQGRTIVTAKDIQAKRTTLTSGEDVSRAMASLIGNEDALGEAFHITADQDLAWNEISEIYMRILHQQGVNATLVEQELGQFLTWRSGKYQVVYDRLYDRIFDNKKIGGFVNTRGFIAPQAGLAQCLERFLQGQSYAFKTLNWREEALKDRAVNQWARLTEPDKLKQQIIYNLFRILPKVGRLIAR